MTTTIMKMVIITMVANATAIHHRHLLAAIMATTLIGPIILMANAQVTMAL